MTHVIELFRLTTILLGKCVYALSFVISIAIISDMIKEIRK